MSQQPVSDEEVPRQAVDRRQVRVCQFSIRGVPACTRPFPLGGLGGQSASHGVVVNVVDGGQHDSFRRKVSVVARPFLPVPKGRLARSFLNGEPFEQRTASGFEQVFDPHRIRLLDGRQQTVDLDRRHRRVDQQVNVLRHEHESDEAKLPTVNGRVDGPAQLLAPDIIGEQWHPSIAPRGLRPQPKLEQNETKVTKAQQSRDFGNTV